MKIFLGVVAIICTTLLLYWPLTRYYFFQDDFILLDMGRSVTSIHTIFKFSDTIFWRPIGAQGYFAIASRLFGLYPFTFHVLSLGTHIVNALLIWMLVHKITESKSIGWLSGFLFATSPIHFMSLLWIGEYPILLGFLFCLLMLLSGWYWIKKSTWPLLATTAALYGIGLLTHEMVVLMPLVIIGFGFYFQKNDMKRFFFRRKHISQLALLFFPGIVYLIYRLFIFPIHISGSYGHLGLAGSLKSLWWYLLWILNIPEELAYQSFFPLHIRLEFFRNFPIRSLVWTLQPILFIAAIFAMLSAKKVRQAIRTRKYVYVAFLWLFFGGALLLLALGHQYPFLLIFAFPGFAILLSSLCVAFEKYLGGARGYLFLGIILVVWFTSSWLNVRFTESHHWGVKEANIAEKLIVEARQSPGIATARIIVVPPGDDGQRKAALADQLGMRMMLNNPSIQTYYGDYPGLKPPECESLTGEKLISCMAAFIIVRIKG